MMFRVFALGLLLVLSGACGSTVHQGPESGDPNAPDARVSAATDGAISPDARTNTSADSGGGDGAAVGIPPGGTAIAFSTVPYRGLSLAGAEFGANSDGTFNGNSLGTIPGDYYYPDKDWPDDNYPGSYGQTAFPYFRIKGVNTFRLPFRWERLQRRLNADLDASELASLTQTVADMEAAGAFVLLDVHNYARYATSDQIKAGRSGALIGSSGVPYAAFADLWKRLAQLYKDHPNVIFGLMNEPFGYNPTSMWREAANAAIAAIRETGAKNLILVCGNEYADAESWEAVSDVLKDIKDPANNFAFEVHVYPDADKNGSGDSCPDPKSGSKQLQPFTDWARKHKVRGFLGEFAAGTSLDADKSCMDAVNDELNHVEANADVYLGWTYWAGGQGWGTDSPMEYGIVHKNNSPQMDVLEKHMK